MLPARKLYMKYQYRARICAIHLIHVPLLKAKGEARCNTEVANNPQGLTTLPSIEMYTYHCTAYFKVLYLPYAY